MKKISLTKYVLFIFLIFPSFGNSAASNEVEIKSLMKNYLIALNTKDKNKLSQICTEKYMKLLQSNGTLDKTFEQQKPVPADEIKFDMKFQKAARTPNRFFVNIKDKKAKEYGEHWYVVNLDEKKFLIDDMVFFD